MLFNLAPSYPNAISIQLPEILTFGNSGVVYSGDSVYSGVRFGSDGKIYRSTRVGNWQAVDTWLLNGNASSYYLVKEVTAGYPDTTLDTDSGTLQQMNANLDYRIGVSNAGITYHNTINFSIASDSGGTNILASVVYLLSAKKLLDRDDLYNEDVLRPGFNVP